MHLYKRHWKNKDGKKQTAEVWTAKFYFKNRQIFYNTKCSNKYQAKAKATEYLADLQRSKASLDSRSMLFDDLVELIKLDYKINKRASEKRMKFSINRLLEYFRGMKVVDITSPDIARYVEKRQNAGRSNSTINRELSALKRCFVLAARQSPPLLISPPHIQMLKENNIRDNFLTNEEFKQLFERLPMHVKPVAMLAFHTGMRKSEITKLRWEQVDITNELIRLTPKGTKNQLARVVPLNLMLKKMLTRFQSRNQENGINTPWVFMNEDLTDRIKSFRKSWLKACEQIGMPNLWFHDLRRCGLRNMIRAGINEAVAMRIGGWRTHSAMKRYEVIDESTLITAMNQVFEFLRDSGDRDSRQTDTNNKLK